jgi:cytochrome b pre-mRNA-processing protein 3
MAIWPFRRSQANTDASRLLAAVQSASRQPALFGDGRISDTLEGRFELLALNAALALIRLRADPKAVPLAQEFIDQFFASLDAGLREAGVGDTAVPKRMHKLAGDFYGRLDAYGAALATEDGAALEAALTRNLFRADAHPFTAALARHAEATARTQAATALEALFGPDGWPSPPG